MHLVLLVLSSGHTPELHLRSLGVLPSGLLELEESSSECKPWCSDEFAKGPNQLKLACTTFEKCLGCEECVHMAAVAAGSTTSPGSCENKWERSACVAHLSENPAAHCGQLEIAQNCKELCGHCDKP